MPDPLFPAPATLGLGDLIDPDVDPAAAAQDFGMQAGREAARLRVGAIERQRMQQGLPPLDPAGRRALVEQAFTSVRDSVRLQQGQPTADQQSAASLRQSNQTDAQGVQAGLGFLDTATTIGRGALGLFDPAAAQVVREEQALLGQQLAPQGFEAEVRRSIGGTLPLLPASLGAGATAARLGAGNAVTAAAAGAGASLPLQPAAVQDALADGRGLGEALTSSALDVGIEAGVTGAFGLRGFERLLRSPAAAGVRRGLARRTAGTLAQPASEAAEEAIAEGLQALKDRMLAGEPLEQAVANVFGEDGRELLVAAAAGGVLGTPGAVSALRDSRPTPGQDRQAAPDSATLATETPTAVTDLQAAVPDAAQAETAQTDAVPAIEAAPAAPVPTEPVASPEPEPDALRLALEERDLPPLAPGERALFERGGRQFEGEVLPSRPGQEGKVRVRYEDGGQTKTAHLTPERVRPAAVRGSGVEVTGGGFAGRTGTVRNVRPDRRLEVGFDVPAEVAGRQVARVAELPARLEEQVPGRRVASDAARIARGEVRSQRERESLRRAVATADAAGVEPSERRALVEAALAVPDEINADTVRRAQPVVALARQQAERAKPAFDQRVSEIAEAVGGEAKLAPVKRVGRSLVKVARDLARGDIPELNDALRATVVASDAPSVERALGQIEVRFTVRRAKDRMAQPLPSGYRDHLLVVETGDGGTAEIQISVPEMIEAKARAHLLYEQERALDPEDPRIQELQAQQRAIYQAAWSRFEERTSASRASTAASNAAAETGLASAAEPSNSPREVSRSSVIQRPSRESTTASSPRNAYGSVGSSVRESSISPNPTELGNSSRDADIAQPSNTSSVPDRLPPESAESGVGLSRLRRSQVARVFPGSRVEEVADGFDVQLPSGQQVQIRIPEDGIPLSEQDIQTAMRTYGKTRAEILKMAAAGAFELFTGDRRIDGLGLILVAEGRTPDRVLRHEALHLARQAGLLSEAEWQALVGTHAQGVPEAEQEEAVARAAETWRPATGLLPKLRSFTRRLVAAVTGRPSADLVAELMQQPRFWERVAKAQSRGRALRLDPASPEPEAPPVPEPEPRDPRARLANPAESPEGRAVVETADRLLQEAGLSSRRRSDQEVRETAEDLAQNDFEGVKERILQAAESGEQLSDVETVAAKIVVSRLGQELVKAGGLRNTRQYREAFQIIQAYRQTGSETARALRQRRDPVESPAQRHVRILTEGLTVPPRQLQRRLVQLRERGEDAKANDLEERWLEKVRSKIVPQLQKIGIDLDGEGLNAFKLEDRDTMVRAMKLLAIYRGDRWGALEEYWRNSILSGPQTQVANLAGNAAHAAWALVVERTVEAVTNTALLRPLFGLEDGARTGELPRLWGGLLRGMMPGLRNGLRAWKTEEAVFEEQTGEQAVDKLDAGRSVHIAGTKGRVIRWPQRLLLFADELSKTMIGHGEAAAQAYRLAKDEGLRGQDLEDRVQELLADHGSVAWLRAVDTARELTFQTPLGPIGEVALKAREALRIPDTVLGTPIPVIGGFPIGFFIMPFITTPINIVKTGVRKSPLGSAATLMYLYATINNRGLKQTLQAFTQAEAELRRLEREGNRAEARAMRRSVRKLREQLELLQRNPPSMKLQKSVAEQAIAWTLTMVLAGLLDDEEPIITGSSGGTYSPGKVELEQQAAPPQSIRLGDTWYSYSRIEPFATVLAGTVDALNAIGRAKQGDRMNLLTTATTIVKGAVRDKTFLRGIGDLLEAMESERGATRYARNFAVSWVPNLLRQTGRATQDTVPDLSVWGDSWVEMVPGRMIQQAVPGLVQGLPRRDLYGREIDARVFESPTTDFLWRLLVPVRARRRSPETAYRMHLNWNAQNPQDERYPSVPSNQSLQWDDGSGTKRVMSPDQKDLFFKESGERALAITGNLFRPEDAEAPTARDMDLIRDVHAHARRRQKEALARRWTQRPGESQDLEAVEDLWFSLRKLRDQAEAIDRDLETAAGESADRLRAERARLRDRVREMGWRIGRADQVDKLVRRARDLGRRIPEVDPEQRDRLRQAIAGIRRTVEAMARVRASPPQ